MSTPDNSNPHPQQGAAPAQPPYGAPAPQYPPMQPPQGGQHPVAPQYGAPQYGAPGAYGYPMPQAKPSTGTLSWALTYLTVSIVLIIVHVIVLVAFSGEDGMTGFFPLGIPITLYFAISILHVVLVIVGTVKASGGKVLQVPFAIPYIRS